MKLIKQSKQLLSFFTNKKCIPHSKKTKETREILAKLYYDIKSAHTFIESQKGILMDSFYKMSLTKIHTVSQIPSPSSFTPNSFPEEVRRHIHDAMTYTLLYTLSLFDREITIRFIVEEFDEERDIPMFNDYVDKILVWLFIVNEYGSKKCSKKLSLYIYFTSLKKELPKSHIHILNQNNVNTAFTYTCPVESEIVVFRKEEWFKVLMHESFHNFALDFSDMNTEECRRHILSIFKVDSEVNLYEAYTECWAEIMNIVFCSFYLSKNGASMETFLSTFDTLIYMERNFKLFQMVKTLSFMGLTYQDLYSDSNHSTAMRETLYREQSNVLSYYIIATILLNDYSGFLLWCHKHNLSLLQFKKTTTNLREFCTFIEKKYKTKSLLEAISCVQDVYTSIKHGRDKKSYYLLNNMRMTLCELG